MFEAYSSTLGECRLNPQSTRKGAVQWCGQHSPIVASSLPYAEAGNNATGTLGLANAFRCSFCGGAKEARRVFVSGPNAYICNDCVALCVEIIAEHDAGCPAHQTVPIQPPTPAPRARTDTERLDWHEAHPGCVAYSNTEGVYWRVDHGYSYPTRRAAMDAEGTV